MTAAVIILLIIVLIAVVLVPMLFYVRLRTMQRLETERLLTRMEQSLGASVKLIEVRDYYEFMAGELKKMLDEAFRDGNRFRQDHLRRLSERLEQLKARTLDNTVRILAANGQRPAHKRRRRGGRRHRPAGGAPGGSAKPDAPKPGSNG